LTSSTARSDSARRLRSLVGAIASCVAVWVLVCAAAESLARNVEARLDANLWRFEEWMQLLSPARYPSDKRDRIVVIGPSEAREAFWPEPFQQALDGATLVNDSLSLSTFEDALTQLEYIEKVYGRGAIGDRLLVAVTPRLLQGYAPGERPLPILLNRYSPHFALDERVEPQALVAKGFAASLLSRVRLAAHSGVRYQRAVRAVALAIRAQVRGEDRDALFRAHGLVGSRFFDTEPLDKRQYYEWARTGTGILPSMEYFFKLRTMDARMRRGAIVRQFERLRAIASRNDCRILVVNMPEGGWARQLFYKPGIHEAYMEVLREAVGDLPFVDLREELPDDGFFDWMHPTRDAALTLSRKVAAEIRQRTSDERVEDDYRRGSRGDRPGA
jgi:hypothetical protein